MASFCLFPATRYSIVLRNGNASDTITPFLCIWRYQWKRVRHKSAHYCVSGVSAMNNDSGAAARNAHDLRSCARLVKNAPTLSTEIRLGAPGVDIWRARMVPKIPTLYKNSDQPCTKTVTNLVQKQGSHDSGARKAIACFRQGAAGVVWHENGAKRAIACYRQGAAGC